MEKQCPKCKEVKDYSEFYKDKSHTDGLRSSCKQCESNRAKTYRKENPVKCKNYYSENREKILARGKKTREKHGVKYRAAARERWKNDVSDREKKKAASLKWKHNNKGVNREYARNYSKNNRCQINLKKRERSSSDDKYYLSDAMRNALRYVKKVVDKNSTNNKLYMALGYTYNDLEIRLRSTLKALNKPTGKKYTWSDFMDGSLQIDHITPVYVFDYKSIDDKQFKLCWAIENLRLLPAKDNQFKGKEY